MNNAIAGGPNVIVTLQPVTPKTVPASNYPAGSAIVGHSLFLGSVPARVWFEAHVTGWAPEMLKTFQVKIDATDQDEDGGGYFGENADCEGAPVEGAGDLSPALVPCTEGTCQGNPAVICRTASNCTSAGTIGPCNIPKVCSGNPMISCIAAADCTSAGTTGPCISQGTATCRAAVSGRTSTCAVYEPSHCTTRPLFFPPGGYVCEWGFFDACDPEHFAAGLPYIAVFETDTMNARLGWTFDPGGFATDFGPSYSGTFVLDVPANAKGRYVIDVNEAECFMFNQNNPPNNNIPIAVINRGEIHVATCSTNADCQDGDACTEDVCQAGGCCSNEPVASWNLATECCNPTNGVQAPIPQSTSCRIGGCSLGGSSGSPAQTLQPDGTACSDDPCYDEGQCSAGACIASQYAGSGCAKPRFISFDIITGATSSAYRVRLVSLHHPNPPYGGPVADFTAFEGEYRWVGAPASYAESSSNPTPVHAAFVGCEPHYRDWSMIDLLHVTGAEIVPSSVYEVQSIAAGVDVNVEANFSTPITIITSRWCDVVLPYAPPSITEQPDAGDHAALIDKFRGWPQAISKPRALVVGFGASGIPDLSIDVDFSHISAAVDAFRNRPYPFAGPIPCP